MSPRSDHLIERAAARLRDAASGNPPPASLPPASLPPAGLPPASVPDGAGEPLPPPGRPGHDPAADAAPNALVRAFQPFVLPPAGTPPSVLPPAGTPYPPPPPADDAARPSPVPPAARPSPDPFAIPPGQPAAAPAERPPPPQQVELDALERAGMVVARATRSRISEEYRISIGRILRTRHESAAAPAVRNVLMVTSARPGEGKSFTALNLAGSIAQNGADAVMLVDMDSKVMPLSEQLGLGKAKGFLDLVADPSLSPDSVLHATAIPNLTILPVGTKTPGAAQNGAGPAALQPLVPALTRLARRFPKHLIMLDAPPCLSTSDPHTLAPHVGQVVLVVEAERTQRTEVEAAIDLVHVCPNITMILNKVRMTTSHTFGAYDYFGSYN